MSWGHSTWIREQLAARGPLTTRELYDTPGCPMMLGNLTATLASLRKRGHVTSEPTGVRNYLRWSLARYDVLCDYGNGERLPRIRPLRDTVLELLSHVGGNKMTAREIMELVAEVFYGNDSRMYKNGLLYRALHELREAGLILHSVDASDGRVRWQIADTQSAGEGE